LDTFEYVGVIRENQGEIDFIHFVFVAKNVTQEPLLMEPEKCEGWHWRYSTEINEMMLPGHIAAIKMYQQHMSIYDLTQQNIAKTE
jgi:hypothetical protein